MCWDETGTLDPGLPSGECKEQASCVVVPGPLGGTIPGRGCGAGFWGGTVESAGVGATLGPAVALGGRHWQRQWLWTEYGPGQALRGQDTQNKGQGCSWGTSEILTGGLRDRAEGVLV